MAYRTCLYYLSFAGPDAIRALMDDERIIIIACHDKEEMEYMADTILYMSEGRLEEGA